MPVLDALLPPDSVRQVRLGNGLTVLVRRDPSAPVVAIVTWVRAGYFDEPDDLVGIAHVLEHMYFKGTPTRGVGEIARETKAAGGYLNAGTIYDHTHYYVVLPREGLQRGIAVQADAYAHSVIDAGELARELEVIIEETKRKADNPSALAVETLFEVLHDQHRIRRWRMGREAPLRALTREQLLGFYRGYYRPSNTVLAIVGDIDVDEAVALAERHYGAIPDAAVTRDPGPVEPDRREVRLREWEGDIAQSELLLGWRTPHLRHEDTPALEMLAMILTGGRASRLMRAVRDRQLVSQISSWNYTPTELGVFVVHAGLRPEHHAAAARGIWSELARVRAGEVRPSEVARARAMLETQWLRRLEGAEGQANFLASWQLLGDWRDGVVQYDRSCAVSASDITAVAERWLTTDRFSMVLYRPRGSAALDIPADRLSAWLDAERAAPVTEIAPAGALAQRPKDEVHFEQEISGVHCFRTRAGLPILVRPRPGAGLAQVGFLLTGGVVDETDETSGVTTLMMRTALRGTGRRRAERLAEDAESLGAVLASSVGLEGSEWTIALAPHALREGLELLADVVRDPVFPADGLEAERAIALAGVASLRDDMYRQPMRLAVEAAWAMHPYGRSTLGRESALRSITTAEARAWHGALLASGAPAMLVVGDVEPAAAAALVGEYFGGLESRRRDPVAAPEWPREQAQIVESRDKSQTAIAMLFPGPSRDHELVAAGRLIGEVASGLGGRFFEQLRDKQSLAYTVMAYPITRTAGGAFAAYIATSPEKEGIARQGLLDEFAKFVHCPVSAMELERARAYVIGARQLRLASGAAVFADIAEAWRFGRLEDLEDEVADLYAVSPGSMQRAASQWFLPARRIEAVVRGRLAPSA